MKRKHIALLTLICFTLLLPPLSFGEPETLYHSDRFVFRSKEVDDLTLVILNFSRGKEGEKYYGEFFGAVFTQTGWWFLEGNDKYFYKPGDLKMIQPSYFAKVEGSAVSGFKLRYDGGDFTLHLSSGPTQPLYTPDAGKTLQKKLGVAEAVLNIRGQEHWGELVHETVVWEGFNGLKRYKGLFKEYHSFYLMTEKGREVYLHRNKSNTQEFLNKYNLAETLLPEGGLIRSGPQSTYLFKPPIPLSLLESIHPLFAFYTLPQRWKIDAPSVGTLYIWSRGNASKNWIWGGYYLMSIEGVLKTETTEERVWGLAEYIPN
jgi:hypothetical protein